MTPYEAAAVFAAFQCAGENESLMWRVDMASEQREMTLHANVSDVFFWATADAEEITVADVPLLEQCVTDLRACGDSWVTCYLAELFAARKRKLRPQRPVYKEMPADVAVLFDACCTAEERAEAEKRDAAWWIAVARKVKADEAAKGRKS